MQIGLQQFCFVTFAPHQSQNRASEWLTLLHLEQATILPCELGTGAALCPLKTGCGMINTVIIVSYHNPNMIQQPSDWLKRTILISSRGSYCGLLKQLGFTSDTVCDMNRVPRPTRVTDELILE